MSKKYNEEHSVKYQFPAGSHGGTWEPATERATLLVGRSEEDAAEDSVLLYSNIIIDTTPDELTSKCKLKINLKDTAPDDGEALVIKLRKMKVCDSSGKTAWVYVLASEYFNEESGFDNS